GLSLEAATSGGLSALDAARLNVRRAGHDLALLDGLDDLGELRAARGGSDGEGAAVTASPLPRLVPLATANGAGSGQLPSPKGSRRGADTCGRQRTMPDVMRQWLPWGSLSVRVVLVVPNVLAGLPTCRRVPSPGLLRGAVSPRRLATLKSRW